MSITPQKVLNETANTVMQCALSAGVGYLAARFFTSMNPLHVAVFMVVSNLVAKVTTPVFNKLFDGENANVASKIVGGLLNFAVSTGASLAIASFIGCPMPFGPAFAASVAGVTIGIILTSIVALCILGLIAYTVRQAMSHEPTPTVTTPS